MIYSDIGEIKFIHTYIHLLFFKYDLDKSIPILQVKTYYLIRFGKENLLCLWCIEIIKNDSLIVKNIIFVFFSCFLAILVLSMPSFWPEGIGNAFLLTWRHFEQKSLQMPVILTRRHCQCLYFDLKALSMPSFSPDGKFSLTVGMIMPLGWGEV